MEMFVIVVTGKFVLICYSMSWGGYMALFVFMFYVMVQNKQWYVAKVMKRNLYIDLHTHVLCG